MITAYHRPTTLDEALLLITQPGVVPLGGGVILNQQSEMDYEVVDLQSLKLNNILSSQENLEIGATATLQELIESPFVQDTMKSVIQLEAPINLRNMGTIAGTLVTCDGRSPLAALLLAMDASLTIIHKNPSLESKSIITEQVKLGNFLPFRPENLRAKLISTIVIPANISCRYEYVARTRMDKPIICVSVAHWKSERYRMVVGGWGRSPSLAFDGKGSKGIEVAARNAALNADDEWGSAEYRSDVAAKLVLRCLQD